MSFKENTSVDLSQVLAEYRSRDLALKIVKAIKHSARELKKKGVHQVNIMHVCGTHEDTLSKWAIRSLLPQGNNEECKVRMVAGPGCPVCITPVRDIEFAVNVALKGYSVLSYGDMIRVPGARNSLSKAKIKGADVKTVYSMRDAIKYAKNNPEKEVCFFSPGFETTAPLPAVEILNGLPENMVVFSSHRLVPPALEVLATHPELNINAFILPGHVSTIIGVKAYEKFFEKHVMPCVISGFEPTDMLESIRLILEQILREEPRLINAYPRVVQSEGNPLAKKMLDEVFEVKDGWWRGIGKIPDSALELKDKFAHADIKRIESDCWPNDADLREIPKGCRCDKIIIGAIEPSDCPLFMKKCTPETPVGPCMVGLEGTCRIQADFLYQKPLT